MKTHFKSNEIAHIWAHKSAPMGRSPGAMSFNGEVFLSYSTAIARHITHKGKPAIILNDTSFSNTTAKHKGKVRSAIHGLGVPVFHFATGRGSSLDVSGRELFEYAVNAAANNLKIAATARSRKGFWESKALEWMRDATAINVFFGLKRKVDQGMIERLAESAKRAEDETARKAKERAKRQVEEQTRDYEDWKRGLTNTGRFLPHLFPVAFRVEETGEDAQLVSTLGARVPIAEARLALRFVLAHREGGWSRNGVAMRVGHYQLDSISSDGVKAGCHNISWAEIERLTPILS